MTLVDHEGFTLADLDSMPDDGRRYELLGGTIVVNASPAPRHQRVSFRLAKLLEQNAPAGHEVFQAPMDLDLVGEQRVAPDLIVVPASSVGEKRLSLPVLLVVELLSPSTAVWDSIAKRDAYAQSGIEHYWIVDTRTGQERFTAFRLPAGATEYDTVVERTDRVVTHEPIRVDVRVADLFSPPS